jgi:peptide subunit release factor 1 (eRF1)
LRSAELSQAIVKDVEEREKNMAVLEGKRRDILAKISAKVPKLQTPKKATTTEEVELMRKESKIEPLIDLTDMVKVRTNYFPRFSAFPEPFLFVT